MFKSFFLNSRRSIPGPVHQGSILVVDSDRTVCDMIATHFAPEGFSVDFCGSVDEALSIEIPDYQLVVIDLNVDGDRGMSLIEHIKQSRDTENVGVIACSINMSPENIINALSAGADDYLIKPFSLRELMARVRAVLRRQI